MRKIATARRHETQRPLATGPWPRQSGRNVGRTLPRDNQVVHGLMIGLPLAFALWIELAAIAWMIF